MRREDVDILLNDLLRENELERVQLEKFDQPLEIIGTNPNAEPIRLQPNQGTIFSTPPAPNEQIKSATEEKTRDANKLALLQASGQVLAGLAGGGRYNVEAPDYSYLKPLVGSDLRELQEQDELTLSQARTKQQLLKTASEKDKKDPFSQASLTAKQSYIESLRRIGKNNLADTLDKTDLSLDQLEQIFGNLNLQNMETQFEAAKSREALAKMKEIEKKEEDKLTPFQKAEQVQFAKIFSEYTTKDRPQIISNLEKLDNAIAIMSQKESNVSGPVIGRVPDFLKQAIGNEEAIVVREAMQSAVVENLKPILGTQFTQVEGEKIQNLTFNSIVSPKENLRRAKLLRKAQENRIKFADDFAAHLRAGKPTSEFDFAKYGAVPIGASSLNEKDGTVKMRAPNGQIARVRRDQAQKYLDKGAVLVDE